MENRVNVLYLTTRCNMACDYCYEEASRLNLPEQINIKEDDIDKYLEEIRCRERNCSSTVVIMGGEPFMNLKMLNYTIKRMGSIKHKWGVSIITNCTLLDNKLQMIKDLLRIKKENTSITFELSYDASGHFRRVYRNSTVSTKNRVEEVILKFVENRIPFKISYTLHRDNYHNFVKDYIYMCEKFGTKYMTAVKLSVNCVELGEMFKGGYEEACDKLRPYANVLVKKYGVIICDLVCGTLCHKCDKSNFVGNSYCGPSGITYDESKTEKGFDKWGNE